MSIERPIQIPSFWLTKGSLRPPLPSEAASQRPSRLPPGTEEKTTEAFESEHNRPAATFSSARARRRTPAIRAMTLMNQGEATPSMRISRATFIESYEEIGKHDCHRPNGGLLDQLVQIEVTILRIPSVAGIQPSAVKLKTKAA
jgi:hypothetical protein